MQYPPGSIVAASDSSGNVQNINAYDEFGIPASSNATYASRFGFTGQAWLPEVGLYYFKARIYSPTLGRFMQTDPIGYGDGLNMYNYAHSDPINRNDPTGTDGWDDYIHGQDGPVLVDGNATNTTGVPITTLTITMAWTPPDTPTPNLAFGGFAGGGFGVGAVNEFDALTRSRAAPQKMQNKACRVVSRGSTGQVGAAGQGTIGPVSFQISFGVAFDSSGNIALYGSLGPGAGAGGGASAGLTLQTSNAPTVTDLGGPFGNVSGGGGAVGGGTVDGFTGTARNGQLIVGGGATAGAAAGETSFVGVTGTAVTPALNLLGKPTC